MGVYSEIGLRKTGQKNSKKKQHQKTAKEKKPITFKETAVPQVPSLL
jgi:hypothetical protein